MRKLIEIADGEEVDIQIKNGPRMQRCILSDIQLIEHKRTAVDLDRYSNTGACTMFFADKYEVKFSVLDSYMQQYVGQKRYPDEG
jgi:hypothetical protein